MRVALAVIATTVVGITAWHMLPASSSPASSGSASSRPDRLGAREIADIVALLHHDQQGIVLANQAEAQSPTASTRSRASSLAATFQRQARALTVVLDVYEVPTRDRLVDTTRLDVADANAVGCDIMPGDAVSKLAAIAPADFDARFSILVERHLEGGTRMAAPVLASHELSARQLAGVEASQKGLS